MITKPYVKLYKYTSFANPSSEGIPVTKGIATVTT